jgi:hypothetical protein
VVESVIVVPYEVFVVVNEVCVVAVVVRPDVASVAAPAFSLTESIKLTTGGVTTAKRPHCWRKARRSLFDRSSFAPILKPPGRPTRVITAQSKKLNPERVRHKGLFLFV